MKWRIIQLCPSPAQKPSKTSCFSNHLGNRIRLKLCRENVIPASSQRSGLFRVANTSSPRTVGFSSVSKQASSVVQMVIGKRIYLALFANLSLSCPPMLGSNGLTGRCGGPRRLLFDPDALGVESGRSFSFIEISSVPASVVPLRRTEIL